MGSPEIDSACKELKRILVEIAQAKAGYKAELKGQEAQDAAYRKSWTWLPEEKRPSIESGVRHLTGGTMIAGAIFGSRDIVLGGLKSVIQKLRVVGKTHEANRLELVACEIERDAETERAAITRESAVAILEDVLQILQPEPKIITQDTIVGDPNAGQQVPNASYRGLLSHLQRARYELMGADIVTGPPMGANGVHIPHDPVAIRRQFVIRYRSGDPAVLACITQLENGPAPCWLACVYDAITEAECLNEPALAKFLFSHVQAYEQLPSGNNNRKTNIGFCTDELVRELDRIVPQIERKLQGLTDLVSLKGQQPNRTRVGGSPISRRRFKIALSFPGEIRAIVKPVADQLQELLGDGTVFYDLFFSGELARMDLDSYLQCIYHQESDFICVFVCKHYESKEWCGLEWRAIRDLIKRRRGDAIILVRVDDTDPHRIQGIFSTDGYIDARALTPAEIVACIAQRINAPSGPGQTGPAEAMAAGSLGSMPRGSGDISTALDSAHEEQRVNKPALRSHDEVICSYARILLKLLNGELLKSGALELNSIELENWTGAMVTYQVLKLWKRPSGGQWAFGWEGEKWPKMEPQPIEQMVTDIARACGREGNDLAQQACIDVIASIATFQDFVRDNPGAAPTIQREALASKLEGLRGVCLEIGAQNEYSK